MGNLKKNNNQNFKTLQTYLALEKKAEIFGGGILLKRIRTLSDEPATRKQRRKSFARENPFETLLLCLIIADVTLTLASPEAETDPLSPPEEEECHQQAGA